MRKHMTNRLIMQTSLYVQEKLQSKNIAYQSQTEKDQK